MCITIYAALIALLVFYTNYHLEQFALSVSSGNEQWTIVALGWEMLPMIWPVLLLAMVAASALTLFVARRIGGSNVKRANEGDET